MTQHLPSGAEDEERWAGDGARACEALSDPPLVLRTHLQASPPSRVAGATNLHG